MRLFIYLATPDAIAPTDNSESDIAKVEEKCQSIASEFFGSSITITSVDSHFVSSSDITILVIGDISFQSSSVVKPFVQSFYLEQNKNQSRSYSIRYKLFYLL